LKGSKESNGLDENLLKEIKNQLDKIDLREYKK
jgi:RNA-binding protein YhbY